jgi:apolipoprotein N-acyltransferase
MQQNFWFLAILSGLLLASGWLISPVFLGIAWLPWLYLEEKIYQNPTKYSYWAVLAYFYVTLAVWNLLATWWLVLIEWLGGVFALAVNPLLMSMPLLMFHYFRRRFNSRAIYGLWVILWLAYEFLQMQWDLAWAWLTLGNGLAPFPAIIQYYEFTGVLGGSLWVLLVNWGLWELWQAKNLKIASFLMLFSLSMVLFSYYQFNSYVEKGKSVKIMVVQPDIDPYTEKFSKQRKFIPFSQQFERLEKLTQTLLKPDIDLVVYPEAATGVLWDETSLRKNARLFLEFQHFNHLFKPYPKTRYLLGMNTFRFLPDSLKSLPTAIKMSTSEVYYQKYNSAVFGRDTSGRVQIYHKSKLVPGGESLPYLAWLKPIYRQLDDLKGIVSPQTERTVFQLNNQTKIASLICYESTFGEFANGFVLNGAQILTIITNDAFWRNSPEPWQHQQIDRLRAIETRRAIARASHHGYSGFMNQKGEISQSTPLNRPLAITDSLQANTELTFYTLYGDWLGRICFWLTLVILGVFFSQKRGFEKSK